jgi:hypothetical protein
VTPADRALFFFHVPKAGGTSVAGALANRFAAEERLSIYYDDDPDDAAINAARYVTGHVSMSILERFDRRPYSVTVLRDPIERALSMYSFLRELERAVTNRLGLQRYEAALRLAKEHSLDDFIRVAPDLAEHYLGNWQSRMLGGKPLGGTDERLEDALAGLERCDFVGLADRPDESLDWLTRRLGWEPLTPLPRTNVTRTRLRRDDVSQAAMDALLELTAVDREVYAEAVRLYESRAAAWESNGEVTDAYAGIPDAPLTSDLRFGEPIRGSGWLGRESLDGRPHVCWIGHTATAHADLANDRRARSLDVEIQHVVDPALLETLQIAVNGRTVPHHLARSGGGGVIASAPLKGRLRRRSDVLRVELSVDHAAQPRDLDPASRDSRDLAIAVRRIVLASRSAA